MNEVLQNIVTRRSIRDFTDRQVERGDLEVILKAGTYAVSGMNRQQWQFTVVQNPAQLQELQVTVQRAVRAAAEAGDAKARSQNTDEHHCFFYDAPTLVIVSNRTDNPLGRDDCAAALQNMFLMAHALGVGSCWINRFTDTCNAPTVRALLTRLGVPPEHTVYGTAALGYPSQPPKEVPRREGVIVWA